MSGVQERAREAAIVAAVRRALEEEVGEALPGERVAVGRREDGAPRLHAFDLVGAHGALVGEVRSYTLGEGGGRPAGKFAHCYAACLFLFRARARRKVLVLTDHAFWARFRRESEGLTEGIEVLHIPVGPDALAEAEATLADATPARQTRPRRDDDRPRGFTREDERPAAPRRNKGGPGPRGRRPITGQRRDS